MSQLVDTGNGVAEFPDEMSHGEIAGVIKKQFYSADNPPPAEISANLQELGVDTARPEDSFDPTSKPAQVLTGIAKGVGSIIPKSVGEAAKMLTYTPIEETPHALKEAYDVIRGVPTKEAVPESQTLTGFLDKSLAGKSQTLTELLTPLAIGVAGLRGALRPHTTLTEKLAPISKETPIEAVIPKSEEVVAEATAKPEILTPQEEVTPQGQAEPVGVTETLAELTRRNGVTPGEAAQSISKDAGDIINFGLLPKDQKVAINREYGGRGVWDGATENERLALTEKAGWTEEASFEGQQIANQKWYQLDDATKTKLINARKARPVPEAGEAPVESGLQAKPELPENAEVTIKASTSKGEELEVKMDAREAEKVLNERKTALENLIDCLG